MVWQRSSARNSDPRSDTHIGSYTPTTTHVCAAGSKLDSQPQHSRSVAVKLPAKRRRKSWNESESSSSSESSDDSAVDAASGDARSAVKPTHSLRKNVCNARVQRQRLAKKEFCFEARGSSWSSNTSSDSERDCEDSEGGGNAKTITAITTDMALASIALLHQRASFCTGTFSCMQCRSRVCLLRQPASIPTLLLPHQMASHSTHR